MAIISDDVKVLDENLTEIFTNAELMRATIREESRPMEHPIETGAIITDHRVIMPVEINLSILVEYQYVKDVYNQIKQIYNDGKFVIVQTRSADYRNQFIMALPHEESAEREGVIVIALRLKEAQVVSSQSSGVQVSPSNPSNESTVDSGIKEPKEPTNSSALASFTGFGA
jgi:hypothetical protein